MKIIVDENIPMGVEAFSTLGEVFTASARKIDNIMVKDADILITRSQTKVNRELLEGTAVKFAGTCTIGLDHYDTEYLKKSGVVFSNAAGCNSQSVAEYWLSAISYFAIRNGFEFKGKTVGIIGVGNIGKKIKRYSEALGMEPVLNDPPLKRLTGGAEYRPIEEALKCDIVTFHTPLNKTGIDISVHLLNEVNIQFVKPGAILFNCSRGPVVDNKVLLERITSENDLTTILDVWENEPDLMPELLERADLGTAHIAGYSLEGKINGTKMIYDKLCEFLGTEPEWSPAWPEIKNREIDLTGLSGDEEILHTMFRHIYPVEQDSKKLKAGLANREKPLPVYFDYLRKNYLNRREMGGYKYSGFSGDFLERML